MCYPVGPALGRTHKSSLTGFGHVIAFVSLHSSLPPLVCNFIVNFATRRIWIYRRCGRLLYAPCVLPPGATTSNYYYIGPPIGCPARSETALDLSAAVTARPAWRPARGCCVDPGRAADDEPDAVHPQQPETQPVWLPLALWLGCADSGRVRRRRGLVEARLGLAAHDRDSEARRATRPQAIFKPSYSASPSAASTPIRTGGPYRAGVVIGFV